MGHSDIRFSAPTRQEPTGGGDFRSYLVVYFSALLAVLALYFIGERVHFQDERTDWKLFELAFPQLALVAVVPAVLSRFLRPKSLLGQLCTGAVLGPVFAMLAYTLYPLVKSAIS